MKEVPSAQPLKAAELALHSSSSGSMTGPQRKRKRPDEEEGPLNGDSGTFLAASGMRSPTEGAATGADTAAASMDAEPDQAPPDQVTWDIEQPAGLQEVVRWSTDQQAWPLLQAQLQAGPQLHSCACMLDAPSFQEPAKTCTFLVPNLATCTSCLRTLCMSLCTGVRAMPY